MSSVTKAPADKLSGQPKPPGFLRHYLAAETGRMALLTALLVAGIAAQIINPLIMRHFIDAARAHSPMFVLTSGPHSAGPRKRTKER